MAKKAMIEREQKRIRMVEKYSAKRSSLKQIIRNVNSSDEEKRVGSKEIEQDAKRLQSFSIEKKMCDNG